MRILLLIIISSVLMGCLSPKQKWAKKRNRAKHKIEKLVRVYDLKTDTVEVEKIDTVVKLDTITIAEIKVDTSFSYKIDTVYSFLENGVETKIEIRTDTIKLNTRVLERDTIYKTNNIVKTKIKTVLVDTKPEKIWKIPWWVYLIIGILILLIILIFIKNGIQIIKFW